MTAEPPHHVTRRGKVHLPGRINDEQDVLRCIGLATGKEDWTCACFAPPQAGGDPKAGKWKGGCHGSRNLSTVDAIGIYILAPMAT